MGGDHGLRASLPAAIKSLESFDDLHLVLVGDQDQINQSFSIDDQYSSRVSVIHTTEQVAMDDSPGHALRKLTDSSMRRAIEQLKDQQVDGVVSAGNTGALMALGCHLLNTVEGIDRPAFCAAIPRHQGVTLLLDVGANLDCSPEQLHQFAVMGSALSSAINNTDNSTIGLLNVGEEQIKGNKQVKLAATSLAEDDHINFVGYVEANDIYSNKADVVVCDGFAGNAVLKACEGTAHFIRQELNFMLAKSLLFKLYAGIGKLFFKESFESFNPDTYNGASFLGLQGVIVKSHGNSNEDSFFSAISLARKEVIDDVPSLINNHINHRNS